MLLAIDCGNTNTVFAVWDGERFLCTLRTSTHHARTADAYFTWYSTLIKHYGIEVDITDVIISSTVPRVVFNLRVFADQFFGCRPLVVGKPDCALPVEPRVDAGLRDTRHERAGHGPGDAGVDHEPVYLFEVKAAE